MANPIVPEGFGSTYLSSRIESYADLVYWAKSMIGAPIQYIELTDAQWATIIDEALNIATQWELGAKEEYLVFTSCVYEKNCGVKLDDLLSVGCNDQYCYNTVITETTTSTEIICEPCGTFKAYVSASPFQYPTSFDVNNPESKEFTGTIGQHIHLTFDPKEPWNMKCVCDADCVTINPVNSQWFKLSANPCLSGIIFDFENDSSISNLVSIISSYPVYNEYPLSSIPLSAMGDALRFIPISYFDIQCFYPDNYYFGPPVSACVNIGKGNGVVYPNCDTSLLNACSALSSQYGISPNIQCVLSSIVISSVTIETTATNFDVISTFFEEYCGHCMCNCEYLSSYSSETSAYTFEVYQPVLSCTNNMVYDITSRDVSDATHIILEGIPSCTQNGSIPLNTNNGIIGTFVLCNSGLSTNGPMFLESVQFLKDFKPPEELLYDQYCGWENNGFTLSRYVSATNDCVRHTPEKVQVDVTFCKKHIVTHIGTVSTTVSGNFDYGINRKRKVSSVFSLDPGNQTGSFGFGNDLLFNFDYALVAGTFGYDLQGSRSSLASRGYDLVSYHLARSFVETSRKLLRYVSYVFDPKTQYLKIIPEPVMMRKENGDCNCCKTGGVRGNGIQAYVIGVKTEAPIKELLSEYWVREWVLARAKYMIGGIRSKYANTTLFGGASIDGAALLEEGKTRMERLMSELRELNYYTEPSSMMYIH